MCDGRRAPARHEEGRHEEGRQTNVQRASGSRQRGARGRGARDWRQPLRITQRCSTLVDEPRRADIRTQSVGLRHDPPLFRRRVTQEKQVTLSRVAQALDVHHRRSFPADSPPNRAPLPARAGSRYCLDRDIVMMLTFFPRPKDNSADRRRGEYGYGKQSRPRGSG